MTDAASLEDVQRLFGDAYTLERELGGGGMSRVYVGEERALGRRVVIKVLPPELAAAVSTERFRREIQLAAQLQHPHIVPVLSAGSAGDLLYYTMPFVQGSSLRQRLARDGALPPAEVVRIMRDVASALASAHRHGVVHRDIKPDNILLSEGHAVVTDFGIAKALSGGPGAAPTPAPGATTGALTALGTSIGTPAYMAPEQGVGDPSTGHRADIYSLGAVAYELLTGDAPFGIARTPHEALVAHMVEAPAPLESRRPGVPPALAALVMRCLAKRPEDRPQTADEVLAALDAVLTTGATTAPTLGRAAAAAPTRPDRRRVTMVAAALLAVLLVAGGSAMLVRRGAASGGAGAPDAAAGDPRIVVAPFENATGDRALDPIGRMAADWLTRGLAQTGLVKVVDARAALAPAPGADSGAGRLQALGRATGATGVVTGSYYRLGDTLVFDPKLVDAATGEVLVAMEPVRGPVSGPTETIERLRQRTLGALATRFDRRLASWVNVSRQPPSYAAYEAYVAGMDAMTRRDGSEALAHFREAMRRDTAWAQARLWIVEALEAAGRNAEADSAVRTLAARREALTPVEQALLDENVAYLRGDRAADLAAQTRIVQLSPTPDNRISLAYKLAAARRPRAALDTLVRVPRDAGRAASSPDPLLLERTLRHRLGDLAGELTVLDELGRRFPQLPTTGTLAARATALGGLGRVAAADSLVRAMAATPRSAAFSPRGALLGAAVELRAHGQPALADTAATLALALFDAEPADSLALPRYQFARGIALLALRRYDDAAAALARAASRDTSLALAATVGVVAAHRGDTATASRVDARLAATDVPYSNGAVQVLRARIAAARGDRAAALELLRAAAARGNTLYEVTHAVPEFDALSNDPAFQELVRPLG